MITQCRHIEKQMGGLFSCSEINEFIRIRTPFMFPDGDIIDLFFKDQGGISTLTDLGETVRWLKTQFPSPRRSSKQKKLISDICLTHGIEFFKGQLMLRVSDVEKMATSMTRLAQACIRVSDLWFTLR